MSFNPHASRFVPLWLLPAIETDSVQTSETADSSFFSLDDRSTNNPAGQRFDEALEQISSDLWCVCPLCGAIVSSDRSIVS